MDTAMRDLEQIEERDPRGEEGALRRAGAFILAALLTLTLVYGMAAVLAGPEPATAEAQDPLAALDQAEALAVEALAHDEEPAQEVVVDREALTFPTTLLDDERPEVAAALAAAAAEHETLTATAAQPAAASTTLALPAAAAATGEAAQLAETRQRDPLVAAALPPAEPRERGWVGQDGRYTLQVVSYREEEAAELFAEALRSKGHDAFILEAEIEGRGTYYRVRIGPFETMGEAQRYRRRFEAEEQMDTFVVRRRDDD